MSKPSTEVKSAYLSRSKSSFDVREIEDVSKFYLFVKRTMDIFVAMLALFLTFPVFLIVSVFYMFGDSKGPLLFKQQRYGKNGQLFNIYKFRSMVVNADEKLKKNQVLYQKYLDNNYKLEPEEDPRITKLGRFLRKTSLDELPQLINVLKGDMSLVGPRPIVEEELKEYGSRSYEFLSAKPGVTGYWQVSGRSEVGYPERVDLELYYVYNQSFYLDVKILVQTFLVVFLRKGAF